MDYDSNDISNFQHLTLRFTRRMYTLSLSDCRLDQLVAHRHIGGAVVQAGCQARALEEAGEAYGDANEVAASLNAAEFGFFPSG